MYGTDYKRKFDIFPISRPVKIVSALIVSLLAVATIALYKIRIRFELPGNSFGSVIADCLIAFIGGGHLRMEHRFERWFFGILMMGAFFIISVFGGDLVDSVEHVLNSKVEAFEDLTKTNLTVYVDRGLAVHSEDISGMLK